MKQIRLLALSAIIALIIPACTLFQEGSSKKEMQDARGTKVWQDKREQQKRNARELEGQFDDQRGDANSARPAGLSF